MQNDLVSLTEIAKILKVERYKVEYILKTCSNVPAAYPLKFSRLGKPYMWGWQRDEIMIFFKARSKEKPKETYREKTAKKRDKVTKSLIQEFLSRPIYRGNNED